MNRCSQTKQIFIEAKDFLYKTLKDDIPTIEHSFDVFSLVNDLYIELPHSLKKELNEENLLCGALLHDVGKSSITKKVLNKPFKLNAREKETMKKHAEIGKKILIGTRFKGIADWVCYHHERIDGNGYFGLTREQIPLESKIISVADTYSALTLDRVYRKRCSANEAIKTLINISGTQLDESLVNIFCTAIMKK